jgi:hypothetical protein
LPPCWHHSRLTYFLRISVCAENVIMKRLRGRVDGALCIVQCVECPRSYHVPRICARTTPLLKGGPPLLAGTHTDLPAHTQTCRHTHRPPGAHTKSQH